MQKNIWRYGVYNEDGSRASITNPSFPIKSEVTDVSTATTYPVYGWQVTMEFMLIHLIYLQIQMSLH